MRRSLVVMAASSPVARDVDRSTYPAEQIHAIVLAELAEVVDTDAVIAATGGRA